MFLEKEKNDSNFVETLVRQTPSKESPQLKKEPNNEVQ